MPFLFLWISLNKNVYILCMKFKISWGLIFVIFLGWKRDKNHKISLSNLIEFRDLKRTSAFNLILPFCVFDFSPMFIFHKIDWVLLKNTWFQTEPKANTYFGSLFWENFMKTVLRILWKCPCYCQQFSSNSQTICKISGLHFLARQFNLYSRIELNSLKKIKRLY